MHNQTIISIRQLRPVPFYERCASSKKADAALVVTIVALLAIAVLSLTHELDSFLSYGAFSAAALLGLVEITKLAFSYLFKSQRERGSALPQRERIQEKPLTPDDIIYFQAAAHLYASKACDPCPPPDQDKETADGRYRDSLLNELNSHIQNPCFKASPQQHLIDSKWEQYGPNHLCCPMRDAARHFLSEEVKEIRKASNQ